MATACPPMSSTPLLGALVCCLLMSASLSSAADFDSPADAEPVPKLRPPDPLPDYAELWRNPQAIAAEEQSLWTAALAVLSGAEGAGCSYARWTAPCPDCGASRPRDYAYAAGISLAADTPRLLPLSVWFDTPVVHDASSWVLERFDAGQEPALWTLATIGGALPTTRQRADYQAEKSASAAAIARAKRVAADNRDEGKQAPDAFHPAVVKPLLGSHPPTVTLRRGAAEVVLGTAPDSRSRHPAAKGMQFTYSIDPATAALKSFDQRILRPYSPHWGLKFRSFRRSAVLQRDPRTQRHVVVFQEEVFTARLTMVFAIANHTTHWYGDFGCDRPFDAPVRKSG